MHPETLSKFEIRARIIKAMAHPTRLFIVEKLSHGKHCVRDLTQMIGSDISTVSKHLAVLKNAGIIGSEKQGANVYYYLKIPCVLTFFGCVESVLKQQLEEQSRWIT